MIVRNIHDKEVLDTTYIAHGGAIAQMILDGRILKEIGFLAIARLAPGRQIEAHVDPMEEIYFVVSGTGQMRVDDEHNVANQLLVHPAHDTAQHPCITHPLVRFVVRLKREIFCYTQLFVMRWKQRLQFFQKFQSINVVVRKDTHAGRNRSALI